MISSEFEVSKLALLGRTILIINPTTRWMVKANFFKSLNAGSQKRQQSKMIFPGNTWPFLVAKNDIISGKTV